MTWYSSPDGAEIRNFIDGAAPPAGWVACEDDGGSPLEPAHGLQRWDAAARAFTGDSAALAAGVTLRAAEFWDRWRAAAALQSGEPLIKQWTKRQIQAAADGGAIPQAVADIYVERCETAGEFDRVNPELDGNTPGAAMTTLGALFGLTSSDVDDLFLGNAVTIDRAQCPITTPLQSEAAQIAELQSQMQALIDGLANGG